MDKESLNTILSRLNRSAFEKFVVEFFTMNDYYERCFQLPEAGEGVYYQEIRDSYGGSLHSVFLLHYAPLELFKQHNPQITGDPVLIQKLKAIKKNYKGKIGYWGMVSPKIKKADKLQSISFVTNLYGVAKETYQEILIPEYFSLAQKAGVKKPKVFVGSYDSFAELNPGGMEEAFQNFISKYSDGICITLSPDEVAVNKFVNERNLTRGVFSTSRLPYEPVFIDKIKQKESAIQEFEFLINKNTDELSLERFIVANYQDIFGNKYDRVETQMWLRFPDIDISGHERRLDVFLRNSVVNDWELYSG